MFIADPEGRLINVNSRMVELAGYSGKELLDMNITDLFPSDDLSREATPMEELARGKTVTKKRRMFRQDGGLLPVEVSVRMLSGGILLSVVRHTTESGRAETALRESEARFRRIVESSPLPIGIYSKDGRVEYINPKFSEVFNYTLEDMPGLNDWYRLAFPDPAYREQIIGQWQWLLEIAARENRSSEMIEARITGKDGSIRTVQAFGALMGDSILVVFNDLTERRLAEDALHSSQLHLSAILNNIPDIAWLKDSESRFIAVNEAFAEAAGCASGDLAGKTDFDIWPHHLAENYPMDDGHVMRSREQKRVEERLEDSVGNQRWIDTIKTPILDEAGEVIGTTGIARDITKRKLAEEALGQANLVVENSPVVLFRWRAAEGWPVAMVSRNVIQFGYTAQELLSGEVQFASIVHPEDMDRVAQEVREYSASGAERFQQQYRIVTKDGGVRWVDDRTVVERNPDGQIAFYQGIVLDITEHNRM
ncbi:MAG: PAS domain S-box protein, partial [Nitrospirae bacterium]|nr:PAS domain S-box protein [Nitrospirota bacterium]